MQREWFGERERLDVGLSIRSVNEELQNLRAQVEWGVGSERIRDRLDELQAKINELLKQLEQAVGDGEKEEILQELQKAREELEKLRASLDLNKEKTLTSSTKPPSEKQLLEQAGFLPEELEAAANKGREEAAANVEQLAQKAVPSWLRE